jgi:general secretion pathway protein G
LRQADEIEWETESQVMIDLKKKMIARRRQRGITLIELLVVLTIISLIAGMVAFNVLPELDKSRVKRAMIDINSIESALDQYRLDMFNYPTTEQGLDALKEPPADVENSLQYRPGGYLQKPPLDPWGRPYQYRQPGEHGPIDVFSLGADGEAGGEGVNADIVNWSEAN